MSKEKKVIDVTEKRKGGGFKKTGINILVTLIVGFVYFYLELPAINFQSRGFYFFFFMEPYYCIINFIICKVIIFSCVKVFSVYYIKFISKFINVSF